MAKVLIADNDRHLRAVISEIIKRVGHEVTEAVHASSALLELTRNEFDLMLVDIIMPEKKGVEAIVQVRHQYPRMGIIAMAGGGPAFSPHINLRIARRLGADSVLHKPFTPSELLEQVDRVLQQISPNGKMP